MILLAGQQAPHERSILIRRLLLHVLHSAPDTPPHPPPSVGGGAAALRLPPTAAAVADVLSLRSSGCAPFLLPAIADLLRRTQARHDIRTRIVRFLALRARLAAMAAADDDESATTGPPVADMTNNQLRAALNEHGVRYGRMKRRAMMDTLEPLEASPSGRVRISRKLRVPAEVLEAEVGVGLVAFDPRLVRDVVPLIMQFAGRASSEDPPLERVCACCGAEGELVACAGCYHQWYCGPECQKARWKSSHKKLCGWFVEKYGRG